MEPGDIVGDRFEIERPAAAGGIGLVFRALDRHTGLPVALKTLHTTRQDFIKRFEREIRLLAELQHPGIVRFVAHGTSADGTAFLAMEWLEGEVLDARLKRGRLAADDAVSLIRRLADALAAAHRANIVHRDLSPRNVFLVDGAITQAKILDFGVAHFATVDGTVTHAGVILGTPGYMSPEQARGSTNIDARADVFALGCLLFRCLTGRRPFGGKDLVAILMKTLLEEPPRLRELRPDLSPAVDRLVARMLSKSPLGRPVNAAALHDELVRLGPIDSGEVSVGEQATPHSSLRPHAHETALTADEDPIRCMVIARLWANKPPDDSRDATLGGHTIVDSTSGIAAAIERHGGRLQWLFDGSLVITIAGGDAATDHAVRAGRCALAVRALHPQAPVAVVAARAARLESGELGDLVDRAVALVATASDAAIRVDDSIAGLLEPQFTVERDATGLVLRSSRGTAAPLRTLLGRPSPHVGRDRELGVLLAAAEECIETPRAHVVLVTAPAGAGKSRLRYELLRTLEARGTGFEAWIGRGDPMSAASPFALLAAPLRAAAGILEGEPSEVSLGKLRAFVVQHVPEGEVARVVEFVGEALGVRSLESDSVQMRAARRDPMLMSDQVRRSLHDLLEAKCRARPLILALEDLQWSDSPSVQLVDSLLRAASDLPFMVLALARPDVHDVFPSLWFERHVQEIRLSPLHHRAAERLVRDALGSLARPIDEATVARIVELAAGNAFYLEELIRAVAEGRTELPETVLAMVHARFDALEPEARRVLRAASVFGQVFWLGGVRTLVGGDETMVDVRGWLDVLVDRELVTRRSASKFPGEIEYVFRHALLREGAHRTLTEHDLSLGHRLAGEWLERTGEREAAVLAEHFDLGGDRERAADRFFRAADESLRSNDPENALALCRRGEECEARGELLGGLRLIGAQARSWRGDYVASAACAVEAMALLPAGGAGWCVAVGEAATAYGRLGERLPLEGVAKELASTKAKATSAHGIALARTAVALVKVGSFELARSIAGTLERAAEHAEPDPIVAAWLDRVRIYEAIYPGGPENDLRLSESAYRRFVEAGDLRSVCLQAVVLGDVCKEIGLYERAEHVLREALPTCRRMGLDGTTAMIEHNLGMVLAQRGSLEESLSLLADVCRRFHAKNDLKLEAATLCYLAWASVLAGDLPTALEHARTSVTMLRSLPTLLARSLAVLARIELRMGDDAKAMEHAGEAMALLESLGHVDEGEASIRLAFAEALRRNGRMDEARAAIGDARSRVLARAERISDPELRACLLERVPDHVAILALADTLKCD